MDVLDQIEYLSDEVQLRYYLTNNKALDLYDITTPAHTFFQRKYWNRADVDQIIPLSKHRERYDLLQKKLEEISVPGIENTKPYVFYSKYLIPTFRKIEKAGLYTLDGMEYTRYNLFTKTGRPSNSNNGTNYAALNKEDGTRRKYKTRFKSGRLVEFDYDAYHLRLIADLIGYEAPQGSFHEHMGKQYFQKDELTQEEYKESKGRSFRIMYGGTSEEDRKIEFFRMVDSYINDVYRLYKKQGFIETPLAGRKLYRQNFGDMPAQKIFNYLIQAYETEVNVVNISKVFKSLQESASEVILYTYDAILVDIDKYDTYIVGNIQKSLQYPTKFAVGPNYHDMQKAN